MAHSETPAPAYAHIGNSVYPVDTYQEACTIARTLDADVWGYVITPRTTDVHVQVSYGGAEHGYRTLRIVDVVTFTTEPLPTNPVAGEWS